MTTVLTVKCCMLFLSNKNNFSLKMKMTHTWEEFFHISQLIISCEIYIDTVLGY